MTYWSTASPRGCVQVRVMVVASGEEAVKVEGDEARLTGLCDKIIIVQQLQLLVTEPCSTKLSSVPIS